MVGRSRNRLLGKRAVGGVPISHSLLAAHAGTPYRSWRYRATRSTEFGVTPSPSASSNSTTQSQSSCSSVAAGRSGSGEAAAPLFSRSRSPAAYSSGWRARRCCSKPLGASVASQGEIGHLIISSPAARTRCSRTGRAGTLASRGARRTRRRRAGSGSRRSAEGSCPRSALPIRNGALWRSRRAGLARILGVVEPRQVSCGKFERAESRVADRLSKSFELDRPERIAGHVQNRVSDGARTKRAGQRGNSDHENFGDLEPELVDGVRALT